MLKWLAILAVLGPLATVGIASSKGTPLSTPKQGIAKQNSGQNGGIQAKPQDSNNATQNSAPPLPIHQPSTQTCDEICQQGRQNLDIQGKLKTFTGWLVAVGLLQALALFGTVVIGIRQEKILHGAWKEIHSQARHMSRQADLMSRNNVITLATVRAAQESARVANAQIQMVKDKERARISVSVSIQEFEVNPAYSFDAIPIEIANDGTTSAFGVRAQGNIFGQPGDNVPHMGSFIPITIPDVIRADNAPTQAEIILVQDINFTGFDESPLPYFFHIGGIVEYKDVFGESHQTTFRFRLQISTVNPIPDSKSVMVKSISGWKRFGSLEENRTT
jgi:hypothetical protein